MTVIVETEVSHLQLLQGSLPGSVALGSVTELDPHLKANHHEYAVVLGPSVPLGEAAAFADRIRIHRPSLGVILLRDRVESQVLTEALRSGMREVVEARDLTGLAQAVARAQRVAEAMLVEQGVVGAGPTGSLVTVFSTKGGVGKSLVATNLAAALADHGQSVCLVDLDVQNGDVAIMLQLTPLHQLNDLTMFGGVIDEGAVTSLMTEHSPGLSIIAAPVQIDSPDQATPEDVGALLEQLKSMVDVVVVDTSGAFDDFALTALDRTDRLVLVGTLDIPALKGLKLATGTLDLLNFPRERWSFVLNRADAKVGLTESDFEETLGVAADCRLVSSREVLAAVNRGEALVRAYPGHANSKAISKLAGSLLATPVSADTDDAASGHRRAEQPTRRRLLGKVRS